MLQGKQSFGTKTVVLFHAVTLMPPGIINRKRHVGNDVVHIVYVERRRSDLLGPSGLDANSDSDNNVLISGDFGLITIFVIPFEQAETVKVTVKMRQGLDPVLSMTLSHLIGTLVVPKKIVASFVRQLAIRADLACRSQMQDRLGRVSNWEERLIQIQETKRYRQKP